MMSVMFAMHVRSNSFDSYWN